MKKLYLLANTSIEKVELALEKTFARIEKETNHKCKYDLLYGRTAVFNRTYTSDFVLLLGPNAYINNQDSIKFDAVGIMFGDPMNMGQIKSKAVEALDFTMKEDGYGFFLKKLSVMDLAKEFYAAYQLPDKEAKVTIRVLDPIPNILNSVKDTTSFVQHLSALNYSIRDELVRTKVKRAFISWSLDKTQTVNDLVQNIVTLTGMKPQSKRIVALTEIFDGKNGVRIKKAIAATIRSVKEKTPNFKFEKLAADNGISAYDLRYIAHMVRSNTLLLEDIMSDIVHEQSTKGRYVQETEETNAE